MVVTCDEPHFADEEKDILLTPTLIIEVLSKSTESYDRGKKFENYRSAPSLKDYILISQEKYHSEHFAHREDNKWIFWETKSPDATIQIPSIECMLSMKDIYEKVKF